MPGPPSSTFATPATPPSTSLPAPPMMFSTVGSMLSPSPAVPSSATPSGSAATDGRPGGRRRRRGRRPARRRTSRRARRRCGRSRWPCRRRTARSHGMGSPSPVASHGRRAGAEVGGVDAGATVGDGRDRHADAAAEAVVAVSERDLDQRRRGRGARRHQVAGERLRGRGGEAGGRAVDERRGPDLAHDEPAAAGDDLDVVRLAGAGSDDHRDRGAAVAGQAAGSRP